MLFSCAVFIVGCFLQVLPRCAGNVLEIGYAYSYLPEQAPPPVPLVNGDRADPKGRKKRSRKGHTETGFHTRFDEGVILSPSGRVGGRHVAHTGAALSVARTYRSIAVLYEVVITRRLYL